MIKVESTTNTVRIREVDENVFTRTYLARCEHSLCDSLCCNYGCPVERGERDRILAHVGHLEPVVGCPVGDWFEERVEDDPDYPTGQRENTRVYGGKCVFFDHVLGGCHLHRLATEMGLDVHWLKPMVCCLFPLTWESGRLVVSEFLDELPCRGQGMSVFDAQKEELRYYFGDAFVAYLERVADQAVSRRSADTLLTDGTFHAIDVT
ncbi:MAG: DUF3109 family protein [Chloroflexota bacterium]|nr:DUF3109 family protein [Chloroflexota bacterium]